MANHWPSFWTDVDNLINASSVWPEITEYDRVTDLAAYDWEELTRKNQLQFPFVIVYKPEFERWEDAPFDKDWRFGLMGIYYIASNNTLTPDVAAALEAKVEAMATELLTNKDNYPIMQIQYIEKTSVGSDNPLNNLLLEQKLPDSTGSITFACVMPGADV